MTNKTNRDIAIESVKSQLGMLSNQLANIRFVENKYEYCIEVIPKLENYCGFWMGFSSYGTYDLCFGHGMAFEELQLDEFPPKDVTKAILQGNVQETVWTLFGMTHKAFGMLTLANGNVLTDKAILTPLGHFSIGHRKNVVYKAYERSPQKT